jgi:hypothetical protein
MRAVLAIQKSNTTIPARLNTINVNLLRCISAHLVALSGGENKEVSGRDNYGKMVGTTVLNLCNGYPIKLMLQSNSGVQTGSDEFFHPSATRQAESAKDAGVPRIAV